VHHDVHVVDPFQLVPEQEIKDKYLKNMERLADLKRRIAAAGHQLQPTRNPHRKSKKKANVPASKIVLAPSSALERAVELDDDDSFDESQAEGSLNIHLLDPEAEYVASNHIEPEPAAVDRSSRKKRPRAYVDSDEDEAVVDSAPAPAPSKRTKTVDNGAVAVEGMRPFAISSTTTAPCRPISDIEPTLQPIARSAAQLCTTYHSNELIDKANKKKSAPSYDFRVEVDNLAPKDKDTIKQQLLLKENKNWFIRPYQPGETAQDRIRRFFDYLVFLPNAWMQPTLEWLSKSLAEATKTDTTRK